MIGARSVLGEHTLVSRGALIGHHDRIGAFVSLMPGANVAGNVTLGDDTTVGMGAVVVDNTTVGDGRHDRGGRRGAARRRGRDAGPGRARPALRAVIGRVKRAVEWRFARGDRAARLAGRAHGASRGAPRAARFDPMLRAILDEESLQRRRLYAARAATTIRSPTRSRDPLVSVTLPTRDRPEALVRSLRSVLAQTHEHLEVLVVGDAAGPEIAAAVAEVGDPRVSYANLTQRIAAHPDPERHWLVASGMARNEAARRARGAWLLHFDDDDTLRPDAIAALLARAREVRAEVVYGGLRAALRLKASRRSSRRSRPRRTHSAGRARSSMAPWGSSSANSWPRTSASRATRICWSGCCARACGSNSSIGCRSTTTRRSCGSLASIVREPFQEGLRAVVAEPPRRRAGAP